MISISSPWYARRPEETHHVLLTDCTTAVLLPAIDARAVSAFTPFRHRLVVQRQTRVSAAAPVHIRRVAH